MGLGQLSVIFNLERGYSLFHKNNKSDYSNYPECDQFLFDVLELSSYLVINDGAQYVVDQLDRHPNFGGVDESSDSQ